MNEQPKKKLSQQAIDLINTEANRLVTSKLNEEIEFFVEKYIDTKDNDKYPYEYIVYDSKVEKTFGETALKSEDVKKFIKLPS